MLLLAPQKYWDEISSSTSEETMTTGTGANRFYLWGIGMEMFYSNPIIGIGQANFPYAFAGYEAGRTFDGRSVAGRQAHNAWVTLISELGLIGTLIVGGMIVRCFMDLKRVRMSLSPARSSQKHGQTIQPGEDVRVYLARAMEGSLIGFIVSGIFISILWYPSLWIMMALVVALRNISEVEIGELGPDAVRSRYRMGIPFPKLGGKPISHLSREYRPIPAS